MSVLFTTNADGEASEVRDFDVFGEPVATPGWANTTKEAFTGHQRDVDIGLVNAGARLYDAAFGVFVSADPLRVSGAGSQGFNPYAYANNDPVNLFDPTGLWGINSGSGTEASPWEMDEMRITASEEPVDYTGSTNYTGSASAAGPPAYAGSASTTSSAGLAGSTGPIADFLGSPQGGTLSPQELAQIPSGNMAPPLSHPNPFSYWREHEVVDTSETLKTELTIAMAVVNLLELGGAALSWVSTRAFIAEGATIAEGSAVATARGTCANGLCPCFVAGTLVDEDGSGKPIEQVELGERVGPELDVCSATDFAQWREVDLLMTVNNHGLSDDLELKLLRPDAWLLEQGMREGQVISVALDDLNVSGYARITRLGTTGHVTAGRRCPVTGWVRHTSHDVIALTLEGDERLGVTRHHRLFSADSNDWVHAGDVHNGEALLTKDGTVRAMHADSTALAPAEVFNLEIFGAHQYFVGEQRVLAHNTYGAASGAGAAEAVVAKLPGNLFRPLNCTDCASAIVNALKAEGISGQVLNITAKPGPQGQAVDFIVSDLVGGGTSLTQNGFHQAVRVGDTVFDNFLRQGVPYTEYVGALAARFGVAVEAVPF